MMFHFVAVTVLGVCILAILVVLAILVIIVVLIVILIVAILMIRVFVVIIVIRVIRIIIIIIIVTIDIVAVIIFFHMIFFLTIIQMFHFHFYHVFFSEVRNAFRGPEAYGANYSKTMKHALDEAVKLASRNVSAEEPEDPERCICRKLFKVVPLTSK